VGEKKKRKTEGIKGVRWKGWSASIGPRANVISASWMIGEEETTILRERKQISTAGGGERTDEINWVKRGGLRFRDKKYEG